MLKNVDYVKVSKATWSWELFVHVNQGWITLFTLEVLITTQDQKHILSSPAAFF